METSAPWPLYSRGKGADRGDGVKTFLPPREGPSGASHSAWRDAVDTPGPAQAAPTPQHGRARGPSRRRLCLEGSALVCPPRGALADSQGNHGVWTTTDHGQASESETTGRLTLAVPQCPAQSRTAGMCLVPRTSPAKRPQSSKECLGSNGKSRYLPGIVVPSGSPTSALGGRPAASHFTDGETEARSGHMPCPGPSAAARCAHPSAPHCRPGGKHRYLGAGKGQHT